MQYPANLIAAILITVLVSYLIGSISFSIIFTRVFDKRDIRTMGSGNAGMTNVLRSAGLKPGILTTVFDFLKGIVACLIGEAIFSAFLGTQSELFRYGVYAAGIAVVLGHMYPVFFGFRGGKGVLTTAAFLLMITPPVLACDFSLFLILALLTKYVSLGSIIAAATFPFWGWLFNYLFFFRTGEVSLQYMVLTTLLLCFLSEFVVGRHHANIGRLLHGTEKKFSLHHEKN